MWEILTDRITHALSGAFGVIFASVLSGNIFQALMTGIYAQSGGVQNWEPIITTAIGQTILFLTTIAGLWWQNRREIRNRAWDLADREEARKKLEAKVETAVVTAKHENELGRRTIINKINENTEISAKAHDAANEVNMKIAELTRQFMEVKVVAAGVAGGVDVASNTLDRVEKKTDEAVDLIKEKM